MPRKITVQENRNINLETEIAVLKNDIKYLTEKVDEISVKLDYKYVTQDEFKAKIDPITKIVYGIVALILTAVVGGLVSMLINRG